MKDTKEQAFVRRYFHDRCQGVKFLDFKGPTLPDIKGNHRVPDFTIEFDDGTEATGELKTIAEVDIEDDEAGWEDTADGALRVRDSTKAVKRICDDIDKAYTQLWAYEHPWIVVLLNQEPLVKELDFRAVFTWVEEYQYSTGEVLYNTMPEKQVTRSLEKERLEIDLYLWIQVWSSEPGGPNRLRKRVEVNRLCIGPTTALGETIASRYFRHLEGKPWTQGSSAGQSEE